MFVLLIHQVGFIDFIVHPLWETWADLVFPDAQDLLEHLEENRNYYYQQTEDSPTPEDGLNRDKECTPTVGDRDQFDLTLEDCEGEKVAEAEDAAQAAANQQRRESAEAVRKLSKELNQRDIQGCSTQERRASQEGKDEHGYAFSNLTHSSTRETDI